ncbi:MAG: protein kinase [Planctomycetota bacterium]|nr:protein kinase [Planctomycetota bacterium]
MPDPRPMSDSDRPSRLDQVLADYLNRVEAGAAPDPADWIAQHPDLADELRSFLRNRESVGRLAEAFREITDTPTLVAEPSGAGVGAVVRYFGDYELLAEIARGGMGVVYQARQVNLNRIVALKMILAGELANEAEIKRFYAEAEAAAALDHPGIVPIFEIGEHEGQHFYSMAFVPGDSLANRVAGGPVPPTEAAQLMHKVAEAVEYAHSRGIIHRDLKPGNVLIDSTGQPRVTDFGLAKQLARGSELTGTGQILGTPSYMPPEQAAGDPDKICRQSDVYSLGAILYCLLTGRPPFQAANPIDTLQQVLKQEPVPLRQLNAQVPPDLETITLKCLEKDPQARFATARELGEELDRFLAGTPIKSRPVGAFSRVVKWARRRPAAAGLSVVSGLALLALVGLAVGAWYYGQLREALMETEAARGQAEDARGRAEMTSTAAESSELTARQSWQGGRIDRMRTLLERQIPKPGEPDLRGFEWHYLIRVGNAEQKILPGSFPIVRGLTFLPGGERLLSAHRSGTNREPGEMRLWDLNGSRESERLFRSAEPFSNGHTSANALALSSNGVVVAVDDEKVVRLISLESGQTLRTFQSPMDYVGSLTFSPDGSRLAVGSLDNTVSIWDRNNGTEIARLTEQKLGVLALAWSPDGTKLVTGSGDDRAPTWSQLQNGELKLWDAATGTEIRTFARDPSQVNAVAFAGNELIVSGGLNGAVQVWDVATGKLKRQLGTQTAAIRGVAFSGRMRAAAVACDDGTARVWQIDTGEELALLRGHAGRVYSVAFDETTGRLATGGYDGTIRLWDVEEHRVRSNLGPHGSTIRAIHFTNDSRTVVTQDYKGIRVFDAATRRLEKEIFPDHWMVSSALSPDGSRLVIGGFQEEDGGGPGYVTLWDVASSRRIVGFDPEAGLAIEVFPSPDWRWLATTGRTNVVGERLMSFWELTDSGPGERIGTWSVVGEPVFSQDSRQLYFVAPEGVSRLELRQGAVPRPLATTTSPMRIVALSTNGEWLAGGGEDGTCVLWNLKNDAIVETWRAHRGRIGALLFAPAGETLVTADGSDTRLWNLNAATPRGELFPVTPRAELFVPACQMRITPDGRTLVTAWETLGFWQLSTGQELLRLEGYRIFPPGCLAISPDGTVVAEGGGNRDENEGVYIWRGPRSRE